MSCEPREIQISETAGGCPHSATKVSEYLDSLSVIGRVRMQRANEHHRVFYWASKDELIFCGIQERPIAGFTKGIPIINKFFITASARRERVWRKRSGPNALKREAEMRLSL